MPTKADLAINGGEPVRTEPFPAVMEAAGRRLGDEEVAAAERIIRSGKLHASVGTGRLYTAVSETSTFEGEFAQYYGVDHAIASTSGTAAIHLAVAAANPEPGDEIITTGLTDGGTLLPILMQNAVPVFADVDLATGNIDVDSVRERITPRTRAIIAIHVFGQPAPVAELRELADQHGIILIEDCAQAYLTRCAPDGALAGTVGHLGCFSLQQSKHITTGQGGLTITNDASLARRARLFGDKGWPRDIDQLRTHLLLGLNYTMTELSAAIAREQLKKLDGIVGDRRARAEPLTEAFADLPGLAPGLSDGATYFLFPVFVDPDIAGGDGLAYVDALKAEGIPALHNFLDRPLYLEPVLTTRDTYGRSGFPLVSPPATTVPTYEAGMCPNTEALISGGRLFVVRWNENYTKRDVDDIIEGFRKVHAAFAAG